MSEQGTPLDPTSFFTVPLFDLGETNAEFAGILAPEPDRNSARIGISEAFLSAASTYHDLYTATDHFRGIIQQAISVARPKSDPSLILDVGSGSGTNSVAPLLDVFPSAKVVATDLSPNLLAILQKYLKARQVEGQVRCVCMSVDKNYFKPALFDLAFGGSILHHIINPVDTLKSVCGALRPEGMAIFSEPFEAGHAFLGTAVRRILADSRSAYLDQNLKKFFEMLLTDWENRIGRDKSDEKYKLVDDKWLFTGQYIKEVASESGLELIAIIPHAHGDRPFRTFSFYNILKFAPDPSPAAFPEWVWAYIDELDQQTSADLQRELLFSGTIIFARPAS